MVDEGALLGSMARAKARWADCCRSLARSRDVGLQEKAQAAVATSRDRCIGRGMIDRFADQDLVDDSLHVTG